MPEGFVPTWGNYQGFEGFSFRPDGLRRIERKIKGHFTSKPESPCFLLTKRAKFYDQRYLLEIKQNYCFGLSEIKAIAKSQTLLKLEKSNLTHFNEAKVPVKPE